MVGAGEGLLGHVPGIGQDGAQLRADPGRCQLVPALAGDGSTKSNASPAEPPCAVGSVSGPMTPSGSMTEPGQPCVMISGSAFSCRDVTWMKWTSCPSIWVVNCGSAFRVASQAPVVVGGPVAGQFLDGGQLHALRPVGGEFPGGPARCGDAPPKVGDRFVVQVDVEGMDFSFVGHECYLWTGLDWLTTTDGRTGRLRPTFRGNGVPAAPANSRYCLTIMTWAAHADLLGLE